MIDYINTKCNRNASYAAKSYCNTLYPTILWKCRLNCAYFNRQHGSTDIFHLLPRNVGYTVCSLYLLNHMSFNYNHVKLQFITSKDERTSCKNHISRTSHQHTDIIHNVYAGFETFMCLSSKTILIMAVTTKDEGERTIIPKNLCKILL